MNVELNLPSLNVDLLSDVLIWAAQDAGVLPQPIRLFDGWGSWKQNSWATEYKIAAGLASPAANVCGTAFCIAGQAAVQTGHRFKFNDEGNADSCFPAAFDGVDENGKPKYKSVGNQRSVSDVGRESLGLHEAEAEVMFSGSNKFGKVAWLAITFARVRGVELKIEPEIYTAASEWEKEYMIGEESYVRDRTTAEYLIDEFVWPYGMPRPARIEWMTAYKTAYNNNGPVPTCDSCGQTLPKE